MNRIKREKITVEKMIRLYCRLEHGKETPCPHCTYLIGYTDKKLTKCSFGEYKPACNDCNVHCYRIDEREKIREIMRYSGPKMIFRHPYLAVMHFFDSRKPAPKKITKASLNKNKV